MSVYLAQLRKDFRATWPLLALWIGGLLLLAALHFGPGIGLPPGFALYATWVFEFLPILITALVVLQEPVADSDAFWLTRPLPPVALVGSKLTLIALFLLAPAILLQGISYARLDLPSPGLASVIAQTALWLTPLVVVAWLLATMSRSVPGFVTWLASAWLLGTLLLVLAAPLFQMMPSLGTQYGTQISFTGIVLGLFAIVRRYQTRRLPAFLIVASVSLVLLGIGPYASAWARPSVGNGPPGSFSLTPIEHPTGSGSSADYVNVGAELIAHHPEGAEAMLYEIQVALRFPDGHVFENAPRIDTSYVTERASNSNLVPLPRPRFSLPSLLSIPAGHFADYAEQRGKLTVRLRGQWSTMAPVDVPARAGQSWTHRNVRHWVRELRLESTQLVLVVDELSVGQLANRNLDAIIYNPELHEILRGATQSSGHTGEGGRALVLSHPTSQTRSNEFILRYDPQRPYSSRTADGYRFFAGPIDAAWLEGARLRFNSSSNLGDIAEVITIEDFRIADWL